MVTLITRRDPLWTLSMRARYVRMLAREATGALVAPGDDQRLSECLTALRMEHGDFYGDAELIRAGQPCDRAAGIWPEVQGIDETEVEEGIDIKGLIAT